MVARYSSFLLSLIVLCLLGTARARHVRKGHGDSDGRGGGGGGISADEPAPPADSPTLAPDELAEEVFSWLGGVDGGSAGRHQVATPASGYGDGQPQTTSSELRAGDIDSNSNGNNSGNDNGSFNDSNSFNDGNNNNSSFNDDNNKTSFKDDNNNSSFNDSNNNNSRFNDSNNSNNSISGVNNDQKNGTDYTSEVFDIPSKPNASANSTSEQLAPIIDDLWQAIQNLTGSINGSSSAASGRRRNETDLAQLADAETLTALESLANGTDLGQLVDGLLGVPGNATGSLTTNGTGPLLPPLQTPEPEAEAITGAGNASLTTAAAAGAGITNTTTTTTITSTTTATTTTTTTTMEPSRMETATNDELWPISTAIPRTDRPEPVSAGASDRPMASSGAAGTSSPASGPYFGGLVAALVIGCLSVLVLAVYAGKRLCDGYQRRHYTKMDYLVNGMYN